MPRTKSIENMTKPQLVEVLREIIDDACAYDQATIGIELPNLLRRHNLISKQKFEELTDVYN